jgi:hypothetical protein
VVYLVNFPYYMDMKSKIRNMHIPISLQEWTLVSRMHIIWRGSWACCWMVSPHHQYYKVMSQSAGLLDSSHKLSVHPMSISLLLNYRIDLVWYNYLLIAGCNFQYKT